MGALIMQLFSVREGFLDCSKDIKMLLSRFASKSFTYLFLPFALRPQPSGSDSCVWWETGVQKCPLPLLPRRGFHFTQPRIWKDHPVPCSIAVSHLPYITGCSVYRLNSFPLVMSHPFSIILSNFCT